MLNSKFNNYNLYILVLGKKTLVKFIIEIPAVKMYNFKKRILILHTNRYLCQIQAIFSIKYDFFLFKCEVCNLKLKLVLEVSMQRKQREERPNTQKKTTKGCTNVRKLQNVPSAFFFCRFPFVLLSRDRKSNHIGLLRSLGIYFTVHNSKFGQESGCFVFVLK